MNLSRSERFEGLFRENYAAVRAYALRRVPRDTAQDVVSETFLVAWRRLEEVPDDALAWLYGVARRVVANERRSADRRGALERRVVSEATPSGAAEPGEVLANAEITRTALATLSERHREALTLVAWHGLSGARAARAAGCSRAAFAVRLHHARARLAAAVRALERQAAGQVEAATPEVS